MENQSIFDTLQANPIDWDRLLSRDNLGEELKSGLFGTHVLHKDPPKDFVRALIDAHGGSIFSERTYDRALHTPLHCACEIGTSPEIVRMILDADPRQASLAGGVRWKVHPLHIARDVGSARIIIEFSPRSVAVRDPYGRLPLHLAAARAECAPELLRLLVEEGRRQCVGGDHHSGGVFVEDEDGVTPLRAAYGLVTSVTRIDVNGNPIPLSDEDVPQWEKLAILVNAAAAALASQEDRPIAGTNEELEHGGSGFNIIHTLLELHCPEYVLFHAIHMNGEQLRERDRWGRLPLSIASANRRWSKNLVKWLLDLDHGFPGAAREADGSGRLPLHVAAASGRDYNDGLGAIFEAAPKALELKDPSTMMHAFMLAAVSDGGNINTIYKLLRNNPNILRQGARSGKKRKAPH